MEKGQQRTAVATRIRAVQAGTATSPLSLGPEECYQTWGSPAMAMSSVNWAGPLHRVLSEDKERLNGF